MTDHFPIGILGGSGLYSMAGLTDLRSHEISTPFGPPSDNPVSGYLGGLPVVFLARHGRGHRLLPGEVPYRANIHALKQLGVKYLVSLSAVGSLNEAMAPLDMAIPNQYIDLTKQRTSSFFGGGAVAHVSMAQPVCARLSQLLAQAVAEAAPEVRLHTQATYVCIEGPQFSSYAESQWYRSLGADLIGMTNMPEAKLAREAQIAYASLAMVTDYDCWHPKEAQVEASSALDNLLTNADRAQAIAARVLALVHQAMPESLAHQALAQAVVTPESQMSPQWQALLALLKA